MEATTPRALARQWRAEPSDRARIDRYIAENGMQDAFTRNRDGELIARITPEIQAGFCDGARCRLAPFSVEQAALAGIGISTRPVATMGFRRDAHGMITLDEDLAA